MSYGSRTVPRALGRREPTDFKHVEKFPLRAVGAEAAHGPGVWGVTWYENFDEPVQDPNTGEWWIGRSDDLGRDLGGHAIAQPFLGARDTANWYHWYDQGNQGACVGFSLSRAMSWLNRRFYDARWLWDRAKEIDEWDDTNPGDNEGTSVRAGAEILRTVGHRRIYEHKPLEPSLQHGIHAYRWVTDVDEILEVVGGEQQERGAITWRNSWGVYYPHKVWIPAETAQRLLDESGELVVFTDR